MSIGGNSNWTDSWYYLAIGVGAAIGTYRVLWHIFEQTMYELDFSRKANFRTHQQGGTNNRRNAFYGEVPGFEKIMTTAQRQISGAKDSGHIGPLSMESVSQLALHSNYRLRQAASNLLFDSAMQKPAMVKFIVQMASEREEAVLLMRNMVQSPEHVGKLVKAGAIKTLVSNMGHYKDDQELAILSAGALNDFFTYLPGRMTKRYRNAACKCKLLETMANIIKQLTEEPLHLERPRGIVLLTACVELSKHYALRTLFHKRMVDLGYLTLLVVTAKHFVAEMELMRVLMESIVRLCTYISLYSPSSSTGDEMSVHMRRLLDVGVIDIISTCIRQDDQGVASWGIGLLHEFVSRGVGREQLAKTPGMVKWLCRKLNTTKYAYTNQLILRSTWYLCITSREVSLKETAQPPSLRRILSVLANENDTDSYYWCVAIASRVSVLPESHRWLLESPLPNALKNMIVTLAQNSRTALLPEMAYIISRMCHSIGVAPLLSGHPDIAEVCHMILASDSENAQIHIVMALANASATSTTFLESVLDEPMWDKLYELLQDFDREYIQNYVTKGLSALVYSGNLPAETLIRLGLQQFLGSLHSKTHAVLEAYFGDTGLMGKDNVPKLTPLLTDIRYMGSASVLLTSLQVHIAELQKKQQSENGSYFMASDVVSGTFDRLFDYQMDLLGQWSMYLIELFNMDDELVECSQRRYSDRYDPFISAALLNSFRLRITSERGKKLCARSGVNTFVSTYYIDRPNDPHFKEAIQDNLYLLCGVHTVSMKYTSAEQTDRDGWWHCRAKNRRHNGSFAKKDSLGFTGDMKHKRTRCLIPYIRAFISYLADTLNTGLVVQSPLVTKRAVWLSRVMYYELPSLRGMLMRLLSNIDLRTLSRADATGVLDMCSSYLVDAPKPVYTAQIPSDSVAIAKSKRATALAEQEYMLKGIADITLITTKISPVKTSRLPFHGSDKKRNIDWRSRQSDFSHFGDVSDGELTAAKYYDMYNVLEPENILQYGRFHAQFALDRYAAGWNTCNRLYSCVVPPVVTEQGSCCWIVDRSGPRDRDTLPSGGEMSRHAPALSLSSVRNNDGYGGSLQLSPRAATLARFVSSGTAAETTAAPPSSSSAVSDPGIANNNHQSSPSTYTTGILGRSPSSLSTASTNSAGSRRRHSRRISVSAFPASIVSDPSVDTEEGISSVTSAAAAAAAAVASATGVDSSSHSLLVGQPKVHYYNHSPFYPDYVTLADGCTIWNSSLKFESVRMRTGIDGRIGGIHRFHVRLLTSGLVQVGWCTDQCKFYPESGEGVGDDYESVAYDGYRRRRWHGRGEDKVYGERWKAGDIISAELDLDNDRVTFYQNGKSLGLAFGVNEQYVMEGSQCGFQGLSRDRIWYPAFSFATEQGLVFLGSDSADTPQAALPSTDNLTQTDSRDTDEKDELLDPKELETTINDSLVSFTKSRGIKRAFGIRFEFQDLDTFPCIALPLPDGLGQITIGPVTDYEQLSSYLQPQWWAIWYKPTTEKKIPDIFDSLPAEMSRWFANLATTNTDPGLQKSALLTKNMTSTSWIYCVVLEDGRICIATVDDNSSAATVVFKTDISQRALGQHAWLPVVSPAVIRFDLEIICS